MLPISVHSVVLSSLFYLLVNFYLRLNLKQKLELPDCASPILCITKIPSLSNNSQLTVSYASPIQSGCCKPPTSCGYTYMNETVWTATPGTVVIDPDCTKWSNNQQQLCYECDSCKAGVLASIKHSWRKVSIINIVVLIILVIVYVVSCAAYRNAKRVDNDEPFGMARMTKAQPSRFQL
jgi:hypothetical protein